MIFSNQRKFILTFLIQKKSMLSNYLTNYPSHFTAYIYLLISVVNKGLLSRRQLYRFANVQSNTGERIETSEPGVSGMVFEFLRGDVLFARLRPYLNKVYHIEQDGVCSTEFHVMRVKQNEGGNPTILPEYLAAILKSRIVLAQTRHMMTGNTHPRLANEDVINLLIPLPSYDVQKKIAEEATILEERQRKH